MEFYLLACGVALNVIISALILFVLWVWFIWPAVEAVSLTRMTRAVCIRDNEKFRPFKVFLVWYREDLIGGRRFESIRGRGWYWNGVGKWKVWGDE